MATSKFTRNLMSNFPSWMKMAKDPDSIGAQFLDVFGVTFKDFEDEMNEAVRNFYITTANTELIDWVYKVPLQMERVVDMNGIAQVDEVSIRELDGSIKQVNYAPNIQRFYRRDAYLPLYWVDRPGGYLYLRVEVDEIEDLDNPFTALTINGADHYDLILHHVWNVFDEFGMLVGLDRLHKEPNAHFKERILDVFRRPGNSSRAGVRRGLARELSLDLSDVSIYNLSNDEFKDSLMMPNGNPSKKLMQYAKQVNETLAFTWDTLNFDKAYWFSIEQDNMAIEYLPHIWDVDTSLFDKEDFQSGVGSGDDLLVHKPKDEPRYRPVKVSIGLMGYVDAYEEVYPEITFTYKIYAKGKIVEKDYQEQPYKYTVRASEVFNQEFQIQSEADIHDQKEINFTNNTHLTTGSTSPNIQFGKSTDILHNQTDPLVKLSLNYNKLPNEESAELKKLSLLWEDTAGKEHSFDFTTSDHFLIDRSNASGNPMTGLNYSDVAFQSGKGLTLGFGDFSDTIDTTEEWRTGVWQTNNLDIKQGNLSLNLGRFNPPGTHGPAF